jgi:hypothetical protein
MQYKLITKAMESVDHEMEMRLTDGWSLHSFAQCGFIMGEDKIQRPMFALMVQKNDELEGANIRKPIGGLGRVQPE